MLEELLAEGMIRWSCALTFAAFSVVVVHYFLSIRRYCQLARSIPGPPGLPIIGHGFNFLKGNQEAFDNVWNSINDTDVCKLWLGLRLFVFVRNPADIELILGSRTNLNKPKESNYFEAWLGDGINIVSGCKWKAYRQLLAPFFQSSKSLEHILHSNSILEKRLVNNVGKNVDCYNIMSDAVMELLFMSILGEDKKTEGGEEYSRAIQELNNIIQYRKNNFWLHPDTIFNSTKYAKLQKDLLRVINRFTRQAVKKRKEALIKYGYRRLDKNGDILEDHKSNIENSNAGTDYLEECKKSLSLLDVMMEIDHNGMNLMDSEIQNQIDAIMLEGHDTTTLTGSNFLRVMADRPDIQEKCVAELNEIFSDSDRPVTLEDTLKMKYLERCLMETLRMHPSVPFIARELQQDLKLASTYLTIPANSTVLIDVKKLHMNNELYSNPDVFNPDNFLLENCVSRHYYSYIPFSAGPRSCIGRNYSMISLKILLSSVLRQYKILPSSDQGNVTRKPNNSERNDKFVINLEHRKQ